MSSVNTLVISFQIDMTTVSWVVGVFKFVSRCIISSITDRTVLTTTKDLEDITLIDIDGRAAPYLGIATKAATKHVQGTA